MRLNAVNILGIKFTSDKKEIILEELKKYLVDESKITRKQSAVEYKPLRIVTPNPEQVVLAAKNKYFKELLNQADIAIPDGIGIVYASRMLRTNSKLTRVAGIELMEELVMLAAKEGFRIGLIGGQSNIAVQALECLQRQFPSLEGWAETPPMLNNECQILNGGDIDAYIQGLASRIQKTKTRLVFVGLGAPKQELFTEKLASSIASNTLVFAKQRNNSNRITNDDVRMTSPLIVMSVGGAFDEISGALQRAPAFIDQGGLKWAWRLVLEPWRWRRQIALLEFIALVVEKKLYQLRSVHKEE